MYLVSKPVAGFLVAIPALFIPSSIVTDLTSIGTLFAFVLVCGGVLVLPKIARTKGNNFQMPYISGKFLIPVLVLIFILAFRTRITDAITNIGNEDHQ